MEREKNKPKFSKEKVIAISAFLITSVVIILLGASLSVINLFMDISFPVLGLQIHGSVFGLAILSLGIKYFVSVLKLIDNVPNSQDK